MKLLLTIGRDGLAEGMQMIADRTTRLYMTPRAKNRILEEIMKKGGMCQRCSLIARSDELENGRCVDGIGCAGDVDATRAFAPQSPHEAIDARALPNEIWSAFCRTIVQDARVELPESEEGGLRW
jgi:hypothetical protein